MQPIEYCREKARNSGSSFLDGFRFLSPERRDAMTVLYAFCREVDDVADDCSDPAVARTTLAWWRQDLAKAFQAASAPEHPVNQALQEIVGRYALPQQELEEIINGMEMDLHHDRYPTFADLQYYCHRVAGVVGRLIARILGFTNPQTLQYAEQTGLALQLTNIIRDVGEDARLGRIYLPQEDLKRFKVGENDIFDAQATPEFAELMRFQAARAGDAYREALALLPAEDVRSQKAGLVMAGLYYALLQEIIRDGVENVLKYKIRIPKPRKMRLALKYWLFGFKP